MPRDGAGARLFCPAASTTGHDSASAAACASRSGASMIRLARPSARPSSWLRAVEVSWRWASGGVLNAKSSTTGSADDPVIVFAEPVVELFALRTPPLAHLQLTSTARSQLNGLALGRAKRIIEAPDLLAHAAADAESWPFVEAAVQKSLALARSRGIEFQPQGQGRLNQTLALSATQGVLLAEWRQLEDGKTVWDGTSARIRASDAFTIQRITEAMERGQLPELFAGIARRPPGFEVRLLLPYTLATAFFLRLRGERPQAFAA